MEKENQEGQENQEGRKKQENIKENKLYIYMGDIQNLRKPSNIPPVTLEELNDYNSNNEQIKHSKSQYLVEFEDDNEQIIESNFQFSAKHINELNEEKMDI